MNEVCLPHQIIPSPSPPPQLWDTKLFDYSKFIDSRKRHGVQGLEFGTAYVTGFLKPRGALRNLQCRLNSFFITLAWCFFAPAAHCLDYMPHSCGKEVAAVTRGTTTDFIKRRIVIRVIFGDVLSNVEVI